jgi:hypothetical protein
MNGILKDPKPMTVLTGDGSFEYTPKTEIGKAFIEAGNASAREGMKPCTIDDVLKAIELERAGYDGLGQLWARPEATSTQV